MQSKEKTLTKKAIIQFRKKIYCYFKNQGRSLPWRQQHDPYYILVSEIMLQQTQVDRVIPIYNRFIAKFPEVSALAQASMAQVLGAWQGLGYNRRALMIHRCAQMITSDHNGAIPDNVSSLEKLPGIGKATAASICVFAFNKPLVFIETNIRTVFIHEFFSDQTAISDQQLLPLIKQTLDHQHPCQWYSALMDYGTYVKKNFPNPSRKSTHHTQQSRFEGSDRQIRGKILKLLLAKKQLTYNQINQFLRADPERLSEILGKMVSEGFISDKPRGKGGATYKIKGK